MKEGAAIGWLDMPASLHCKYSGNLPVYGSRSAIIKADAHYKNKFD
jgi:hypothetical protein